MAIQKTTKGAKNESVSQANTPDTAATPDPATDPETMVTSVVPEVVYEVTAPKLNLRTGPAKSFPVAAILLASEKLIEIPIPEAIAVKGWIPVFYESACGWVMAEHCRKVEE